MQCEKEKSIEKSKYQNPYQRNAQGCIKKPLNEAFLISKKWYSAY